jgi:hypothetical protein
MRIRAALAAAAALGAAAACSSGGSASPSAAPTVTSVVQPQQLHANANSYDMTTVEERNGVMSTILAPADSVWAVLGSVFLELAIEPGTVNNQERYIANTSFRVERKLGGVSIAKYLDCGSSATGPVAQQSQITMSLSVQVISDSADVSRLKSQVNAYAVPEGMMSTRTHCASTGQLESRITRMVNDAIAHRTKN